MHIAIVWNKPEVEKFGLQDVVDERIRTLKAEITSYRIKLSYRLLMAVYYRDHHVSLDLWGATCSHMADEVVTAYEISGEEGIVNQVYELVGTEVNPLDCKHGSLRRDLYEMLTAAQQRELFKDLGGEEMYFYNFLHRSRTVDEAAYHRELIRDPRLAPRT